MATALALARRYPIDADPATAAARVMEFAPASDAEALKLLRAHFPNSPLSLRLAALDFFAQRKRTAERQARL
jgi:hypothetical protein